jgi:chromosome segregation ATPase
VLSKLVLRKCGEHENCQLQKLDDGDWEHTPSKRTIKERLAPVEQLEQQLSEALTRVDDLRLMLNDIGRESEDALDRVRADIPDAKDLKAELSKELTKTQEIRRVATEVVDRSATALSDIQAHAARLPRVLDLLAEGELSGVRAQETVKTAQNALQRLERLSHRLASAVNKQADALQAIKVKEASILDAQAKVVETLDHATEKLARAEDLLSHLQERKAQLDRVDAVYDAVDELSNQLRVEVEAFRSTDRETRRQIEHERAERLEATAKGIRSLRTHIEVSHA